MGCDGGTIPKRDELVRKKKKPEQKSKQEDLNAKWKHCALSSNKLAKPIVSCELGRLYNKEAVIQYLLDKESAPNGQMAKHIRNLKDVVVLNLTEKSEYQEKAPDNGEYVDVQDSQFICPVAGLEMNGIHRFCYLRTCGCVMSERALKEVKSDTCHKCNKTFEQDDIIVINSTDEEVEQLRTKMEERRSKAKAEKKSKKRKTEDVEEAGSSKTKTAATATATTSTGLTNGSTGKVPTNGVASEKAKKEYSVAKDPNASETFKSLFTSHESAKNKPKAHWVTFNPLYN